MFNLLTISNGRRKIRLCAEEERIVGDFAYKKEAFCVKVSDDPFLFIHALHLPQQIVNKIDAKAPIDIVLRTMENEKTMTYILQKEFPYDWIVSSNAYKTILSNSIGNPIAKG